MDQAAIPSTIRPGSPRLRWRFVRVLAFFGPVALGIIGWDIVLRLIGLGQIARRTAPARYRRVARRYRRLAPRRMRSSWTIIRVAVRPNANAPA